MPNDEMDSLLARSFRPSPAPQAATLPAAPTDGSVDLPRGKIAAIATYLELRTPPSGVAPELDGTFECVGADIARYRSLYGRIGEPWLWFTRAVMSDAALGRIISHPSVEAFAFVQDGVDVALVELDFRREGECELVFFGLAPEVVGRGLGPRLLRAAIHRAFVRPVTRLWLHTCTLDHPAAMSVYLRAGFVPYRRAIEIADDPRLTGHLPAAAAPFFPSL